jgi:hypothetical protein
LRGRKESCSEEDDRGRRERASEKDGEEGQREVVRRRMERKEVVMKWMERKEGER